MHTGFYAGEGLEGNIFIKEKMMREAKGWGSTSGAHMHLLSQGLPQNHVKQEAGNMMGVFTLGVCQAAAKLLGGAKSYAAEDDDDKGIKLRQQDSAQVDIDDRNAHEQNPANAHPDIKAAEVCWCIELLTFSSALGGRK